MAAVVDLVGRNAYRSEKVRLQGGTREFKSREVAQAQIYVIVDSLLELSCCTQPFPTHGGWLCRRRHLQKLEIKTTK